VTLAASLGSASRTLSASHTSVCDDVYGSTVCPSNAARTVDRGGQAAELNGGWLGGGGGDCANDWPAFSAPGLAGTPATHVNPAGLCALPVSCIDVPAAVLAVSTTPTSVDTMPEAAPLTASNEPSYERNSRTWPLALTSAMPSGPFCREMLKLSAPYPTCSFGMVPVSGSVSYTPPLFPSYSTAV